MKYIEGLQYDTIPILSEHMDVYKDLDCDELMIFIEQAEEQMHHLTEEELEEYNHFLEVVKKHEKDCELFMKFLKGEIK